MTSPSVAPTFEQLALSAPILRALDEIGYETPSPIQAASIPPLLEGHDILGQAQTGTGKTAAFALPLLNRIDLSLKAPQLLVLAPTRELAIQVAEAFQSYSRHLKGFHVLPIYGGQSMSTQLHHLKRGVHVVVGTPGRVMDHLRRGSLSLDSLQSLVLDEADEMLRMGFIEDVEWILEHTPAERQIALFSATMPEAIRRVAHRHLREPKEIKIKAATATVSAIEQSFWRVSGVHKLDALTRILEVEDMDAAIIFVRTKKATEELAQKLEARGHACAALNGDISQAVRERTVAQLKNKKLDVVVATDVVARGLDVPRINLVINYDIPNDVESYVHRIGRTGRAGRSGRAILFVTPREMRMLNAIEKATGQKMERLHLPSAADVKNRRIEQFKQRVLETLDSEDLDFFDELVANMREEHDLAPERIAAALAWLTQQDNPLQPAPVAEPERAPREDKGRQKGKRREPAVDPRPGRLKNHPDVEMVRYRIEVGRNHDATPRDIVGAIANETGIDSEYIGYIKLFDEFSTIDLPEGMPKDVFQHLKKVRVRQQQLNISPLADAAAAPAPAKRKKKDRAS